MKKGAIALLVLLAAGAGVLVALELIETDREKAVAAFADFAAEARAAGDDPLIGAAGDLDENAISDMVEVAGRRATLTLEAGLATGTYTLVKRGEEWGAVSRLPQVTIEPGGTDAEGVIAAADILCYADLTRESNAASGLESPKPAEVQIAANSILDADTHLADQLSVLEGLELPDNPALPLRAVSLEFFEAIRPLSLELKPTRVADRIRERVAEVAARRTRKAKALGFSAEGCAKPVL